MLGPLCLVSGQKFLVPSVVCLHISELPCPVVRWIHKLLNFYLRKGQVEVNTIDWTFESIWGFKHSFVDISRWSGHCGPSPSKFSFKIPTCLHFAAFQSLCRASILLKWLRTSVALSLGFPALPKIGNLTIFASCLTYFKFGNLWTYNCCKFYHTLVLTGVLKQRKHTCSNLSAYPVSRGTDVGWWMGGKNPGEYFGFFTWFLCSLSHLSPREKPYPDSLWISRVCEKRFKCTYLDKFSLGSLGWE